LIEELQNEQVFARRILSLLADENFIQVRDPELLIRFIVDIQTLDLVRGGSPADPAYYTQCIAINLKAEARDF
jgi:hypothetical protein